MVSGEMTVMPGVFHPLQAGLNLFSKQYKGSKSVRAKVTRSLED